MQFKQINSQPKTLFATVDSGKIYKIAFIKSIRKTGTTEENVMSITRYSFTHEKDSYQRIESEMGLHYKGELFQDLIDYNNARAFAFQSTALVTNDKMEYMLIHLETAELIEKGTLTENIQGIDRYRMKSFVVTDSGKKLKETCMQLFEDIDCYRDDKLGSQADGGQDVD